MNNRQGTALIFGGARGIGAAIVARLAADGYNIAFTYVSRPDKASALEAAARAQGRHAFAIATKRIAARVAQAPPNCRHRVSYQP